MTFLFTLRIFKKNKTIFLTENKIYCVYGIVYLFTSCQIDSYVMAGGRVIYAKHVHRIFDFLGKFGRKSLRKKKLKTVNTIILNCKGTSNLLLLTYGLCFFFQTALVIYSPRKNSQILEWWAQRIRVKMYELYDRIVYTIKMSESIDSWVIRQ